MTCSTCDLRDKEVINVCDGNSIGRVVDFEIDAACGRISALIVCPDSIAGMLFSKNKIRIPWERIVKIGKDAILVEMKSDGYGCDPCGELKKGLKRFFDR